MYKLPLRCKDFDSWITFLGRLDKIGTGYIIKNDIILAVNKNTDKKTDDKIPGKHVIKDPLSLDGDDFDEWCVRDATYIVHEIFGIVKSIQTVTETDKTARKSIVYFRTKQKIGMMLGNTEIIIAELLNTSLEEALQPAVLKQVNDTADSVRWFDDLKEDVELADNNEWTPLSASTLTLLNNNGVYRLNKIIDGKSISCRITRSLFYMAGVKRAEAPIAEAAQYAFLPSDQSDVAILRIQVIHKCGQSQLMMVNCIHEYLFLIFDDGKGDDK